MASARVLWTKEEYELIMGFIAEWDLLFGDRDYQCALRTVRRQIDYLNSFTVGKATCPTCDRLFITTNERGQGWCIKCDWRE